MTGMGGGDGVHGNTTSLVGGGGKGGLGLGINGSAHHKRGVLQRRRMRIDCRNDSFDLTENKEQK